MTGALAKSMRCRKMRTMDAHPDSHDNSHDSLDSPDFPGPQRRSRGGTPKPVMSTMWNDSARWNAYVDVMPFVDPGSLRDLVALVKAARRHEAVILLGSVSLNLRYRDLVLACVLARMPNPPRVLITDATWEARSRKLEAKVPLLAPVMSHVARAAISAMNGPHARFAVLSSTEVEVFAKTWGVPRSRVVFTPFFASMDPGTPVADDGYLFSGGNSLRDYHLLQAALEGLDVPARVATRWHPTRDLRHVEARPVSHEDFVTGMARSHAVVLPLERMVRSAGQQTYLNAMMLGKPVIVTDAPGVRDYIEDGVTGIIVPPEAGALRSAIADVFDPAKAKKYEEMGRRARRYVLENHAQDDYFAHTLLDAVGLPPSAGATSE